MKAYYCYEDFEPGITCMHRSTTGLCMGGIFTKCPHKSSTPKFRKPTAPPPPPMPPVKPAKKKENKTMYGMKLYIPFEDLDTYIHEHIELAHKDSTFIPVKVEVNDIDLGIEISLISAAPNEFDDRRYKLDLNKMPKENNKCTD